MNGKNKLLIVEDDNLNQLAYKGFLSKIYDLKICGDVNEFDSALNEDTYDLFIIDLALNSQKSGIDLIKELRQMDKYKKVPIIVVTAFAFREDRLLSMDAGADKFIVKPFEGRNLIEELKKYFQ